MADRRIALLLSSLLLSACSPAAAIDPGVQYVTKKPVRCSAVFEPFPFPMVAVNTRAVFNLFFRANQICNEALVLPTSRTLTITDEAGGPVPFEVEWEVRPNDSGELAQAANVTLDVPDTKVLHITVRFEPGYGEIKRDLVTDRPPVATELTWAPTPQDCTLGIALNASERLCSTQPRFNEPRVTTWFFPGGSYARHEPVAFTDATMGFFQGSPVLVDRASAILTSVSLPRPVIAVTPLGADFVIALGGAVSELRLLHADGGSESLGVLPGIPRALGGDATALLIGSDTGVERREVGALDQPGSTTAFASSRWMTGHQRLWAWRDGGLAAVFPDGGLVSVTTPIAGTDPAVLGVQLPGPGRPLHLLSYYSNGRNYGWVPIDLADGGIAPLVIVAPVNGGLTASSNTNVFADVGGVTQTASVPP